jgi:hypothetical protein
LGCEKLDQVDTLRTTLELDIAGAGIGRRRNPADEPEPKEHAQLLLVKTRQFQRD